MSDTLPPQPQTNDLSQWPQSLDAMLMQQALASDPPPLSYPQAPAVYAVDSTGTNSHTFYKIQLIWRTTTGMDVLATGDNGLGTQNCHVPVQMHNKITELLILFTAQRIGAQPVRPSTDVNNQNCINTHYDFSTVTVIPYPNGISAYRISGAYRYKLLVAMDESAVYPIGVTPIEAAKATDVARMFDSGTISKSLLDLSGAVPSGVTLPQVIVESPPSPATTVPPAIYIPPR